VQTNSLASRGSVLPDGIEQAALINSVGEGAGIALPADPTTLAAVIQAVDAPATVDLDGKTLAVGELAIQAGGAALTIGAAAETGVVRPAPGALPQMVLPPVPISALNPIIWYDPSDAATVTLNGSGGVTRLANKAATGSAFDAAVPANNIAPLLATGSSSFGPLPMLRSDNANQCLRSLANTGISGNAPRTLIAVVARNDGANLGVSFGNNSAHRIFEVVSRTENTMFGTFNYDLYNLPVPAPGELKLLTFIAESGTPNPLFTFVDGAVGVTGTNSLNTLNTALTLGQRSTTTTQWRGQVGEVILFDYALTPSQRMAVESYLLAKWKNGAKPSDYPLTLRNDGETDLAINAAIVDPPGQRATLLKEGSGLVTLAGDLNHSGATILNAGTLVIDAPQATDVRALAGKLSGYGTFVKTGAGTLNLAGSWDAFLGSAIVSNGVLRSPLFLNQHAAIDVMPAAAFEIASSTANTIRLSASMNVAGAGPDGAGVIRNASSTQQTYAFQNTLITLAGDATFGATQRWDIRNSILDLNGHVLTKVGSDSLCLPVAATISNAPAGVAVSIQNGLLNIESDGRLHPADATRVIEIGSQGTLGLFNLANPLPWAISAGDGAAIRNGTNDGLFHNASVLDGPITLSGTLTLLSGANTAKHLRGQLSGSGSLAVMNNGTQSYNYLSHSNNLYTGQTTVNNATLVLRYPGSLPGADYTRLTVTNNGGVIAMAGTHAEEGFTPEQVRDLLESGRFIYTNNVRAGVDTTLSDMEYPYDIPPFAGRLVKHGPGTLTLNGNADLFGDLFVWGGNLVVTNDVTITLNRCHLVFRPTAHCLSLTNVFGGHARIIATDRGYSVSSQSYVTVAQSGGTKALLTLDDHAFVSARLLVGGGTASDGSAVGAVYHSGNAVWLNTGGRNNDGAIGYYGYGYYQLDGGALTNKGFTRLGYESASSNSIGILRQNGGAFVMNGGLRPLPGSGVVGDNYDGYLRVGASRGGGVLHLAGGTFLHHGNLVMSASSSDSNPYDGVSIVTVEGSADAVINGNLEIGYRHSALATLNLNGGRLEAGTIIRETGTNTMAFVQFNGGTFAVRQSGAIFGGVDNDHPLTVLAHEDGAIIETPPDTFADLNLPLCAFTGKVVRSINITKGGSGYIAPPLVTISGGGGSGATAVAEIDRDSGEIVAVRVTAGGSGYSSAPTLTFRGGGGSGATATAVVEEPPVDGGLKKIGPGTLCLSAPNRFAGAIEVAEGVLAVLHTNAVPRGAVVRLTGGTLRCPSAFPMPRIWYDPADVATVESDPDGKVLRLANKGYSGAVHDAVPDNLTPPLWVTGDASHSAYPMVYCTSGASGLFSLNNAGIAGKMPRSLIAVISRNQNNGCGVTLMGSAAARSGFEILARATDNTRFGTYGGGDNDLDIAGVQAAGVPYICTFISGVDGIPDQLAAFRNGEDGPKRTLDIKTVDTRLGLNVRGTGVAFGAYAGQIGEVMLFDVTLTDDQRTAIENYLLAKWKNGMQVRREDYFSSADPLPGGTVELAGGTLDLSGQTTTSLTVIGEDGVVRNGTLAAGSVLSPGGDDDVGVLSLVNVSLAGAEYRLSFAGLQADLITSTGTLNISGLSITALSEPAGPRYPIIHAEGGLTGTPSLSGLPQKWSLKKTDTDLYLVRPTGTLFTLK